MQHLLRIADELMERPSEPFGFRRPFTVLRQGLGKNTTDFFRRPLPIWAYCRCAGVLSGAAILFCPTIYCANVATESPMRRFRYAYWC